MKDINQFSEFLFELVLESDTRELELVWEEFHSVGDSCGLGLWNVTLVVPVVVHGWAHVVSSACMFCPCASFTCAVMDGYLATWGCQRGLVVFKGTVDQGIC